NVGYWVAGYVFDFVRSLDLHVNVAGFQPTVHEQLFAVSLGLEILLFPTIYFLRRREERDRQAHQTIWATVRASADEIATLFRRLIGQSGFYRLLAFFVFV